MTTPALIQATWLASALASERARASLPGLPAFPPPLSSYPDATGRTLWEVLRDRVASSRSASRRPRSSRSRSCTFFAARILQLAHRAEERHRQRAASAGE
ncbi:MAG: hypothetical protein U1E76_27550 [Planctomycetota bacterium]